jgi:hypothetical protein
LAVDYSSNMLFTVHARLNYYHIKQGLNIIIACVYFLIVNPLEPTRTLNYVEVHF